MTTCTCILSWCSVLYCKLASAFIICEQCGITANINNKTKCWNRAEFYSGVKAQHRNNLIRKCGSVPGVINMIKVHMCSVNMYCEQHNEMKQ